VRAFVAAVGSDSGSTLLSAEIRHVGGALEPDAAVAAAQAEGRPLPGAVSGFDAQYLVYGVGIPVPGAMEGLVASLGRLFSQIEPWRAPVEYLNFAERAVPASRIFGDDGRLARLRAVKQAVDPTGVIRSNHPVRR
jgi:hypothetical protein